jgi:flavin-dependent dehydrogenase
VNRRVVIIGGGPAGAAAGFHLASTGGQVTIVESKVFPRVKVCGEYISPAATRLLEEIVAERELARAGARRVEEFVVEVGERRRTWRTPRSAWALSRAALDSLLLERAAGVGAEVIQPASVRSVSYFDDRVTVNLADGRVLDCAALVHADGSGRHDPAGAAPLVEGLLGFKCHLRVQGGMIEGVTMRACAGAYVGTIMVEGELGTCAFTASRELALQFRGGTDALLQHLWPEFRSAWRTSEWHACGVPRSGYVRPGHPRSLRIGNAAAAVDPVGGEGIGLAIWSGKRVAELLVGVSSFEREALVGCERRLAAEYARRVRLRLPACRLAAAALMRPGLFRALWPLLSVPALSLGPWYRLSGKPA